MITDLTQSVEYDVRNRIKYHPELHKKHRKPLNEVELEYLCKYWEVDTIKTISLALDRTETALWEKVRSLKLKGLYEHYKNLNRYW